MADNYLEKRMDDYLRSRAGSPRRPAAPRPGRVTVNYPSVRVVVADGCAPLGRVLVETLRRMQCRVAFTSAAVSEGHALAQATGSQYHPDATPMQAAARLAEAGDPPAWMLLVEGGRLMLVRPADGRRLLSPEECCDAADVAAWCVWMIHPRAAWCFEKFAHSDIK